MRAMLIFIGGVALCQIRTSVNLVLLDVGAYRDKEPVSGLSKENFEVFDKGSRVKIHRFTTGESRVAVAITIDASRSMRRYWPAVQEAFSRVNELIRSGDETVVVAFGDRAQVADSALQRVRPEGMTSLYDGMILSIEKLREKQAERRVMILVSDGKDTSSKTTKLQAYEALRASNVLVYCIGLFPPEEPDADPVELRRLAAMTGGYAVIEPDPDRLVLRLQQLFQDLRSRYVIAFSTDEPAAGATERRKIKIRVKDNDGKGLDVRSRMEYQISGGA